MNIWKNDVELGEVTFDKDNNLIKFIFKDKGEERYWKVIQLMTERLEKRTGMNLVFNEEKFSIENANELIFLAIRQELFLNLDWIVK